MAGNTTEPAHDACMLERLICIQEFCPNHPNARLLRVLEQREVTRIGGHRTIPVDIRIIAATNRDLQEAVAERAFRLDLYYRLNVVELTIPPLRRRSEDIPLLIERFTGELSPGNKSRLEGFSPGAMDLLQNYAWPGNVRELRNLIEHLVFLAPRAIVEPEDLFPHLENHIGQLLPKLLARKLLTLFRPFFQQKQY